VQPILHKPLALLPETCREKNTVNKSKSRQKKTKEEEEK
jgi:hypothetical protein